MTREDITLIEKITRVNCLRVIQRLYVGSGLDRHVIEEEIATLNMDIDVSKQLIPEEKGWWQFKD